MSKRNSEKRQIDKSIANATGISRSSTTSPPQPGFGRSPMETPTTTTCTGNSIHLTTPPPQQTPHLPPHLCYFIMYGDLGLKLVCLHNLPFSSLHHTLLEYCTRVHPTRTPSSPTIPEPPPKLHYLELTSIDSPGPTCKTHAVPLSAPTLSERHRAQRNPRST